MKVLTSEQTHFVDVYSMVLGLKRSQCDAQSHSVYLIGIDNRVPLRLV